MLLLLTELLPLPEVTDADDGVCDCCKMSSMAAAAAIAAAETPPLVLMMPLSLPLTPPLLDADAAFELRILSERATLAKSKSRREANAFAATNGSSGD
jgi:hypothetical protein